MMIPGFRKHQESKGLLHGVITFFKLQTVNPQVTRNNLMVHHYTPHVYISCTFIVMISSPKQKRFEEFSDIHEILRATLYKPAHTT